MTLAALRRPDSLDGLVHYLVDTPDGSVGVLDGWARDELGRPEALVVRQGWFGRRRFEIPSDQLVEVDHDRLRIVVARGAAPLEPTGLLRRLARLDDRCSADDAGAAPRSNPQHHARNHRVPSRAAGGSASTPL